MQKNIQWYGWKPSLPDHRNFKFKLTAPIIILPDVVDLRPNCPPVYNQGELGSCTANAIAAAVEFDLMKQSKPVFTPSRLFIYYNERDIENTVNEDSGAEIKDGIQSINKLGVCDEILWPYDITQFEIKPPQSSYDAAKCDLITLYQTLDNNNIYMLKQCLAKGFPFVFGFTVYEGFEYESVASDGIVNMPGQDEQILGGHAVLCVGYNEVDKRFIVRNSWGADWALKGYFTMPYQYLQTLASDCWAINAV